MHKSMYLTIIKRLTGLGDDGPTHVVGQETYTFFVVVLFYLGVPRVLITVPDSTLSLSLWRELQFTDPCHLPFLWVVHGMA